jgi:hypothetical protein
MSNIADMCYFVIFGIIRYLATFIGTEVQRPTAGLGYLEVCWNAHAQILLQTATALSCCRILTV